LKPESVSTKQERIARLTRENPAIAFTSLNQYVDVEWMEYAYECTRKDGAVGVDGQSAEEYAVNLRQNLFGLIDRLKSGRYRAPPVRRHYIAKSDGGQRALGIPSFEDKVAQRAIVMLLEPIYEQDFLDCSFGYRPGRNAHQALQVLRSGIMARRGYWVVEVDVRKYFDSIPRTQLRKILARRVTDGVVRKLIDKWFKAGVLEAGQVHYPDAGTPQGGVVTPRTQKVTFSLNASLRAGVARRFLICVSRGNMFTTDGQIEQSGQGAAVERGTSSTRAQRCAIRGCADSIAQVRLIAASSISIPRRSGAARSSSRDNRGNRAGHSQAPAQYGSFITHACRTQWLDYWHARHTSAGRVFRRAKKAWLSGVQDAPHLKSTSTIRLIDCSSRSLRKPMTFWCLDGNA